MTQPVVASANQALVTRNVDGSAVDGVLLTLADGDVVAWVSLDCGVAETRAAPEGARLGVGITGPPVAGTAGLAVAVAVGATVSVAVAGLVAAAGEATGDVAWVPPRLQAPSSKISMAATKAIVLRR